MLLDLTITAQGPLAFAERRPNDQFRASLPYVPGGAIFGALGTILAGQGPFDAALFRALRCHNAYPAHDRDPWVRPLPLTALRPKGQGNGSITDALVARVCWERQEPAALVYAPTDAEGRPWEAAGGGFYTVAGKDLARRSVTQRVLTRVAINRRRGTAEDSRLYSPFVLSETRELRDEAGKRSLEPTIFRGSVVLPDGAGALREALAKIGALGGRTSTGLGSVAIAAADVTSDDGAAVAARIEALTSRFQAQARRYEELHGAPWPIADRSTFTVNLLADAILLEQGWLPTQQLSVRALREAAGLDAELELVRAFTATKTVAGWHSTWQQPKPTHLAVAMGSVFVFQAKHTLSDADCAKLAALQQRGIGERRQEGYGQVRICDTFHTRETWQQTEEA